MKHEVAAASAFVDLGVDLGSVYRRVLNTIDPSTPPHFLELYEEYQALYIETKTKIPRQRIEQELTELRAECGPDIFDVEQGFSGEVYGVSREATLFLALMEAQLFFQHEGRVFNIPVVEVW